MSRDNTANDVNRGLAWVGLASSMVGLLDAVAIFVILALWISSAEYGVAALVITVFPVLDLATEMGLSAAVIQRDDHSESKISTVFWLNVVLSAIMFALLALVVGPALAAWHGHEIIGAMLAVYGGKLMWNNVYAIPTALMRKELRFKELSVIRMLANLAEFAGKIGFAAAGAGIWCFVAGPICRVLVTGIGVQICNPWRPKFIIRIREALDWAAFGLKTSFSQMLFHVYTNIDYQVVGYYFGAEANGFYRLAYEIVLEPCRIISEVTVQIAFPAYSKLKHQKDRLVDQFISFTRMNLVVMVGFLGIVFVSVDDLLFLWNPEYLPAATAARVLCAVGILRAVSFVIPPLLDGIGRPTLTLAYTVVASIVLPAMFWASAHFYGDTYGYLSVAIAWAIGYPVAFIVLAAIALSVLEMPALSFLARVMGVPACAAFAVGASSLVHAVASGLPHAARFFLATATMLSIFFSLLAYWQGISPRSVARAIRGK